MIDLNLEIENLNYNRDSASKEVSRLDGQKSLLSQQITNSKDKINSLESQKINEIKAVELLHLVQRQTRDKIVEAFENTVSLALRAIYNKDYRFKLEFGQRGNLSELDFQVKSPTTEGFKDLKDCSCGGEHDVISLALRFILLHLIQPRLEGPILFDEPTKMLDSEKRQNEYEFYKKMSEKFNRQLIIVTHSNELQQLAENKILIGV